MSNLGFMQLVGGVDPDGKPRVIAVNPDGIMKTTGGDNTGGGGGITQEEIQEAIEMATNLDQIEELIQSIRDRLPSALVGDRLKTTTSIENFPSSQQVSATSLPLPNGASTSDLQTTGNTTLTQIRDAIKAQIDIASTVWTDNSNVFYVRRDLINEGTGAITVTFTLPDGTSATPGAGLRPLATTDRDIETAYYEAIASGTGYSVGDLLGRVLIIDANPSTPTVTAIWINFTLGLVVSPSPSSANIERADETIGARQVGTWAIAGIGQTSDPPATSFNIVASIISLLKGIGQLISDRLTKGANIAANSLPVTLANDGTFALNFGKTSDTSAANESSDASFISLFRFLLQIGIAVRDRLMPVGTLSRYFRNSNGANLKASAGLIYAITCSNSNTSIRYFQLFEKATAPITTDTPAISFPVYPNGGLLVLGQDILGGGGLPLSTGIGWGFSSTESTYTPATFTDCIATVRWN